jgi:membrane peptidoglycan carboxypeptidase
MRIMEAVVTDGTAKGAQIEGYSVAGKTGTAHKVVNRAYSRTDYNVSFVGFVPSTNPRFTIAVVVDTPRKQPAYGGVVAVPIFKRIAEAALRHLAVPPAVMDGPPILVARAGEERHERPTAGPIERPEVVTLDRSDDRSGFPDLRGSSARDAVRVLSRLGLKPVLHGEGVVVSQRPAAGAEVESGLTATLWLRRQHPVETSDAATP